MAELAINIDHPQGDSVGWIYITFEVDGSGVTVHLSDLFNPVFEIAFIFMALAKENNEQCIGIDEEGTIKVICISPKSDNKVHFQVKDYDYGKPDIDNPDYPRIYIDCVVSRFELLNDFFANFIDFINNKFQASRWGGTDLKEYYLQYITSNILPIINK